MATGDGEELQESVEREALPKDAGLKPQERSQGDASSPDDGQGSLEDVAIEQDGEAERTALPALRDPLLPVVTNREEGKPSVLARTDDEEASSSVDDKHRSISSTTSQDDRSPGDLVMSEDPFYLETASSAATLDSHSTSAAAAPRPGSLKAPEHRASHSSSISSEENASASSPTIIYGVVLVSFHHALGPIVEFSQPASLKNDEDVNKNLPFLALPDGAHLVSMFNPDPICVIDR
jgi:hypothetical protein